MKIIPILLFIIIIAVSGCTLNNSPSAPANGIVIDKFYAEPQTVNEGNPVTFYLDIENKGDVTADYITAQLYGLEGMWYIDPTVTDAVKLADILSCWNMNSVNFWWDSFHWSSFAGDASCWNLLTQNNPLVKWGNLQLEPANPETNKKEGDFAMTQWRLYPPDLPEGVKQKFPVTVHIKYAYKSNAVINVKAIQEQEAKRMKERDESVSSPIIVSNTKGPIQLSVERADAPIIIENPYYKPLGINFDPALVNTFHTYNPFNPFFYTETTSFFADNSYAFDPRALYFTTFNNPYFNPFWSSRHLTEDYYNDFVQKATFKFKLKNVGTGSPIFPSYRDIHGNVLEGAIFGTIKLESPIGPNGAPTAWFENCLGTPYGNIVIIDNTNEELVRLNDKSESEFGCTIGIDRVAWKNKPTGNILLVFDMYYLYDISKTTTVTVIGRRESRGLGGWIHGNVPTGPTPSGSGCSVTTADWSKQTAKIGDIVTMNADVHNCKYPVSFEIKEYDPTIFSKDDYVTTIRATTDTRDSSGTGHISAQWKVRRAGAIEDNYQFYFNIKAGNEKIGTSASKLNVGTKGLGCSELAKNSCLNSNNCWWKQTSGTCESCSSTPPSKCSDFYYQKDCEANKCGFNCKWDNFNYCQNAGSGNCQLINAYWKDSNGNDITYLPITEIGQNVKLVANTQNCDGIPIKFQIWEDRSITGDDKIGDTREATRNGNLYYNNWVIERNPNEPNDNQYLYHFDVLANNKKIGESTKLQVGGSASTACNVEQYNWVDGNGNVIGNSGEAKIGDRVSMVAKLSDGCHPNQVYFEIREHDTFGGDERINRECFSPTDSSGNPVGGVPSQICECSASECNYDLGNSRYGFIATKNGNYWKASWVVQSEQQDPESDYSYHFDIFVDGKKMDIPTQYNINVKNNCIQYGSDICSTMKDSDNPNTNNCGWDADKSKCMEFSY